MKVKTSPYERAVNALMRSDPKLSGELEAACRADMKRHLDEQAELAALRAQRDAAVTDADDLRMMLSAWESGDLQPGYIAATEEAIEGGTSRSALAEYAALLRAKGEGQ